SALRSSCSRRSSVIADGPVMNGASPGSIRAPGSTDCGDATLPSLLALLALDRKTPAETIDATFRIDLARTARPERVAMRGDLDLDHRKLFAIDLASFAALHRREGSPLVAGRRILKQDLAVLGMNAKFHVGAPQTVARAATNSTSS